jgi:pimeloyl-ACP methyl ester carboxylesterase
MTRLALIAIIAASFTSTWALGQVSPSQAEPVSAASSAVQRTTLIYATKDGQELKLDRLVDESVKMAGKRPVIIFSVGGGWEGGARNDAGLNSGLTHWTSLGYNVIAIDYRLGIKIAKERKEFTAANGVEMYLRAIQWSVEDLFDATSLVLRHADAWSIDKTQIVLMGGSAGATNSLVAEFNVANETELARAHLPADFRYAGVISMAGAFWLKAGTPLTFKNKPAPIMFFHGAKDQVVTYDEVQGPFSGYGPVAYFRKFAGSDYPKWFVDYPQGDHIIAATPFFDELNEMDAFLQKLVQGQQQLSIHTVEEGKVAKIFQNAAQLLPQPAK